MPAQKSRGFTLVELMVGISIIGILATIGIVVYSQANRDAKNTKRVQDLLQIGNALELYRLQHGEYPHSTTFSCVGSALNAALAPTFMPQLPTDPGTTDVNDINYCYQYESQSPYSDYKLTTNPNLPGVNAVNPSDLNKQSAHIDPSSYTSWDHANCASVQTGAGQPRGFGVFTQAACAWPQNYTAYGSGASSGPGPTSPPAGPTPTPPSAGPTPTPPGPTATPAPTSAPFAYRTNSGGGAYTNGAGTWAADSCAGHGAVFTDNVGSAPSGADPTLYQDSCFSSAGFSYAIPVPSSGSYTVTLKFAEIRSQSCSVGSRRFNVALEGTSVLSNFDIFATAGCNTPVDRTFTTNVTDGTLNIDFTTVAGTSAVNAIQVTSP
jgi:prepilin-type N-terminal cleavage/methylation domain-containing protein